MVFKALICLKQKHLQTSYFLGSWVVCAQTALFFNVSRTLEESKHPAIQTKTVLHFCGFFIK